MNTQPPQIQMTSGLSVAETHSGFDPVSHMLFLNQNMGEFAARSASGAFVERVDAIGSRMSGVIGS